ncbi:hypothetical protein [Comamonas koreensis]|uniref:Uncharacterized protein n=1 Tax=Comamonas koreensis TaxID=160825 RepID=A0AAW4Y0S0_9BURK|nr:hypothetical protein [Comamonas koreensis]MCD2166951.1 hypothetical protein [Comamonas koreensis]
MLFWSRPLTADEWALLARYFGQPQHPGWTRMRLYLRRLGDTRRALSFNGAFLSMPAYCFAASDPRQCLRLDAPLVAGWLAHEALHHWQRLQGRPVTRQALCLQWRFWRHGINPYAYTPAASPAALLAQFQHAQVEQQAQMWQDAVMADIAWRQAALGADQQRLAAAAQRWHAVLDWVKMQAVPPPPPLVP